MNFWKKAPKSTQKPFDRSALVRCVIDHRVSPEQNQEKIYHARIALEQLLFEAKRQLPLATTADSRDYRYLKYLYAARTAAAKFRYDLSCEELLRVVSLEQIQERRVLINLICTLEEFV